MSPIQISTCKEVPYQRLAEEAKEIQIIPLDKIYKEVSCNYGHTLVTRLDTSDILLQPNLNLKDITSLVSIQEAFRIEASNWLRDLYPQLLSIPTRFKSFANAVLSLDDNDISGITNGLVSGDTEFFFEVMSYYEEEALANVARINSLINQIFTYLNGNLQSSLRQSLALNAEVTKSSASNIATLLLRLHALKNKVKRLNTRIADQIILQDIKASFLVELLISLTAYNRPYTLYITNLKVTEVKDKVAEWVAQRDKAQENYKEVLEKLSESGASYAALQVIFGNFESFIKSIFSSVLPLAHISEIWGEIGEKYSELSDLAAEENLNAETVEVVATLLRKAREDAVSLKEFSEKAERTNISSFNMDAAVRQSFPLASFLEDSLADTEVFNVFSGMSRRIRLRKNHIVSMSSKFSIQHLKEKVRPLLNG